MNINDKVIDLTCKMTGRVVADSLSTVLIEWHNGIGEIVPKGYLNKQDGFYAMTQPGCNVLIGVGAYHLQ